MEEIKWDREAFVQQQQQQRAPGSGLGPFLGGMILLFITLGVVAGGGYWFLKTRGLTRGLPEINLPSIGSFNQTEMSERLAALDLRLEQIEKRLNIPPLQPASKPSALGSNSARTSPASSRPRSATASSNSAALPSKAPATLAPSPASGNESASSSGEEAASRETWEATADRLGMAVGELGEQRREIAQTQEDLSQIRQQMDRTYLPFQLWENGGWQRVGPISLELQNTDRKNQRFNLVLQFDDRTVQMKDRVLGERVEFYISGVEEPLELVVSEILPDRISGKLALPSAANSLAR